MDEVTFRLASGLAREAIGVNNEVTLTGHEISNLTQGTDEHFKEHGCSGPMDKAATVKDGAIQFSFTDTTSLVSRRIREGAI